MELSGDNRNSLWSDSESQFGKIREPSVTQGLQHYQKADGGLSGSSGAPELMKSITFATQNRIKQTYQIC